MSDRTARLEQTLAATVRAAAVARARGLGVDVVSVSRFGGFWGDRGESLRRLVFTAGELGYAAARADTERRLAGTFAAKEAVFKALGLRWDEGPFSWLMIEIVRNGAKPPRIVLHERARRALEEGGAHRVLLSISYEHDVAIAAAQVVEEHAASQGAEASGS